MNTRIIVPEGNQGVHFVLYVCEGRPFYLPEGMDARFCPYCGQQL
jgi:hypothetical protein